MRIALLTIWRDGNYGAELQAYATIKMLKELITHLEIALNLDISFHTSLNTIYADCLQKERVYFSDVVTKYRGGMTI